jgi:hypothetical protein
MSKRDAEAYFDSLLAPSYLQPWFARPALRAGELVKVFDVASTTRLDDYMIDFGEDITAETLVFPVSMCWPMGFSWSPAVAQDVMLYQTSAIGLSENLMLADDKPSPNAALVKEFFAVCTDDVIHFSRSARLAEQRMDALAAQWKKVGIVGKPSKDLDRSHKGLFWDATSMVMTVAWLPTLQN